jgi:charged multivesicular body protein 3
MYKVTGSMKKSTEIMKLSNQLVKLPEVSKVMREMSQEMMKVCDIAFTTWAFVLTCTSSQAGIMEEMMEDTLDSGVLGEDEDELETEAEGEVDKVQSDALPSLQAPEPAAQAEDEGKEREDMQRMQEALDGLLRG